MHSCSFTNCIQKRQINLLPTLPNIIILGIIQYEDILLEILHVCVCVYCHKLQIYVQSSFTEKDLCVESGGIIDFFPTSSDPAF